MASVSFDLSGLEQLQRMRDALSPQALDKATASALAYAAKSVPAAAGKAVSSRYNLGSRRVQQDVSRPYLAGLAEARITFARRQPPTAAAYGARPSKDGVRFRVYRGGPNVTVRGAFFQTVRGGQRLPVVADAAKVYRADLNSGRLKPRRGLSVLHGPSVGSVALRKGKHAEQIQAEIRDRLLEQFGRGLERAMGARARGYGR